MALQLATDINNLPTELTAGYLRVDKDTIIVDPIKKGAIIQIQLWYNQATRNTAGKKPLRVIVLRLHNSQAFPENTTDEHHMDWEDVIDSLPVAFTTIGNDIAGHVYTAIKLLPNFCGLDLTLSIDV